MNPSILDRYRSKLRRLKKSCQVNLQKKKLDLHVEGLVCSPDSAILGQDLFGGFNGRSKEVLQHYGGRDHSEHSNMQL